MRNALIFHSTIISVVSLLVFALKGKQTRRERDEMEAGRTELDQNIVGLSTHDEVEQSKKL